MCVWFHRRYSSFTYLYVSSLLILDENYLIRYTVSDIYHPNLNVLLYGDPSLSFDKNKKIFQAVQDFTMKTKRFESYFVHL